MIHSIFYFDHTPTYYYKFSFDNTIRYKNKMIYLFYTGAIFHQEEIEYREAFERAILDTMQENPAPAFKLHSIIKTVDSHTDSFKTKLAGKESLIYN